MSETKRSNRLGGETSPYLLQHAHNPVDWYPWGPEALERARREEAPILLSIGYSACHWCHVMERESFEDPAIAALMNAHFVCVKVDREERPDLDQIYQTAVQVLGGHGGWPLTVFLTPSLEPFFGGTYFPPVPRHGMRSFPQILTAVADAWRLRRDDVLRSGEQLAGALAAVEGALAGSDAAGAAPLRREIVSVAAQDFLRRFDPEHGGFGDRPKFPHSFALELWLRHGRAAGASGEAFTERVVFTLLRMIAGGIHDQLGGGFHRYSVDERWLVPHFEKMLYDNALLLRLLADAGRVRPEPALAEAARGVAGWVLREMTSPEGGFYSTQDADSEGEEGRFFAWDEAELAGVLGGADAALVARVFGVLPGGNFEHGRSVLHRAVPLDEAAKLEGREVAEAAAALENARKKLFEARERRIHPSRDDKVLAGWNGLMIHALAEAGSVFGEPRWVEAAERASSFVERVLERDGALLRVHRAGISRIGAFAEDYAFLAEGELALFTATGRSHHFARARRLVDAAVERFWDDSAGSFHLAGPADDLVQRPRSVYDNAVPSATSSLCHALLKLHALGGGAEDARIAERALAVHQGVMERQPLGFAYLLCALEAATAGVGTLVITGPAGDPRREALLRAARSRYEPNLLVVPWPGDEELPSALAVLLQGKGGSVAAYLCRAGACSLPVQQPEELERLLEQG